MTIHEYLTIDAFVKLMGLKNHEAVRHKLARANARRPRSKWGEPVDLGDGWCGVKVGAPPSRTAKFDPRPWRIRRA
jgi:hypothetical protein